MNSLSIIDGFGHLLICAGMIVMIFKTAPWPRALPLELTVFLLGSAVYFRGWESLVMVLGAMYFAKIAVGMVWRGLKSKWGFVPPSRPNEHSHWLLLNEPDLLPEQVWLFGGVDPDNSKSFHHGVLIADAKEQVTAWVNQQGLEPRLIINEAQADVWLDQLERAPFWALRMKFKRAFVTGYRDNCRWVRQARGNGAEGDARFSRTGTEESVREDQLVEEDRGQIWYWHMHPELSRETDATPRDEWLAEVRELGQAAMSQDQQHFSETYSRLKAKRKSTGSPADTASPIQ